VDGLILPRSNTVWLSYREKWILCHNSAQGNSIWMKFGMPMQNETPMSGDDETYAMSEIKSRILIWWPAVVRNRKYIYFRRRLIYLIEIWYASRFPSSQTSTITKTESAVDFRLYDRHSKVSI